MRKYEFLYFDVEKGTVFYRPNPAAGFLDGLAGQLFDRIGAVFLGREKPGGRFAHQYLQPGLYCAANRYDYAAAP